LFLEEAAKRQLAPGQLRATLQMMPESTIDDVDKREAAVAKRIRALSSVKDMKLRKVRDDAVAVLRPFLRRSEEAAPGQPGASQ
jgi:hypothetical protein